MMKFYRQSFFLVVVTTTSFLMMTPGVLVFGQEVGSDCNLCGDDDLILGDDASSECEELQESIDDGTLPSAFVENQCETMRDRAEGECDCQPRFTPSPTPALRQPSPSPTAEESEDESPSPTEEESEDETPSPTSESDDEEEDASVEEESDEDEESPTAAPTENLYNQIDTLTTRVETLEDEIIEMRSFLNEAIAIALSNNRTTEVEGGGSGPRPIFGNP